MGYFKIRTTLACLIMAILLLGAGSLQAAASTPTMGVDELAPGMKGYGLTVFRGVEPEQFDVEIVAVLSRGSSPGSLILVRASGPRIEEAGGVAEGMSGSPVYVDGRLIG
ncbi:MAG: SpoIVB peptidase S55 domain-containing protein, partial [Bacillota bacterium]